jgi:O-antigen biosynthesis protein WbqV
MISLSGLAPETEVPIVFTGLRPGEKMDEALMSDSELRISRPLRRSIRGLAIEPPAPAVLEAIRCLEAAAAANDRATVIATLREVLPDYVPSEACQGQGLKHGTPA